jgi:hypothetical protein
MVSVAVRVPRVPGAGVNVTMTLHEPVSAVRVNPLVQVVPEVTTAKSLAFVPLMDAEVVTVLEIVAAELVPFVSVTVSCELVVLMSVLVNVSGLGLA